MKKRLLTMMALLANVVLAAVAQETPAITFEAPAVERTITVGLAAAGTVKVDWGNGTPVEQATSDPYGYGENNAEITGTPSGTVKIYADGIIYFQAFTKPTDGAIVNGITSINLDNAASTLTELDVHQNNLTALDLSKLTALTKLTAGVNDFATIDLSANTELATLDLNCTTTGNLTSLNLSNNTKLTMLKANFNKLESLDLSKNTSLKSIYLLNNGMKSVDFGNNTTAKIYISLNNNLFETLDVTALTGLSNGTLSITNNNLTELKLPATVKTLNVTGNKFTLASLYALKNSAAITTLTYSKQQDMEIAATIDKAIDLSGVALFGETATEFVWKTEDGTALAATDYSVANGVTTFYVKPEKKVYAELKNAAVGTAVVLKTTLAEITAAAEKPAITLTAELDESYTREISVLPSALGVKVSLDWGDGVLVEQTSAPDPEWPSYVGAVKFSGKPAGTGVIKIYSSDIEEFEAISVVGGAGITAADLSGATGMKKLTINGNKLQSLDLSNNVALTSIIVSNNQLASLDLSKNVALTSIDATSNKLTSIDLSQNAALMTLRLSDNQISSIDLTANTKLKALYMLNNGLTDGSVVIGNNTIINYISLNNNLFTTFDASAFTGLSKGSLFLIGNNLTELKLPATVKTLNVTGNKFTLASLYALKNNATITNLTYSMQQDMEIAATIDKTIDLSGVALFGEKATEFVWKTEDGTALAATDYSVANGVTTFYVKPEKKVYAELKNAAIGTAVVLKTTLAEITAAAENPTGINTIAADKANGAWYNLKGQRIDVPSKGLYIHNGVKVVIK